MTRLSPSMTFAMNQMSNDLKAKGIDIVNMTLGEPDFNTPENVKAAACTALEENYTHYTPVGGSLSLREAISDKLQKENGLAFSPADILVSNGAKQSLCNVVMALIDEGDEVIIPAPYWLSYPEMVRAAGASVVTVKTAPEDNFELDAAKLEAAVTERTKLLILTTPSNPTGAVYSRKRLEEIAAVAVKHNFMVLADEIYEKLVYDADKPHISIASLSDAIRERTVTVNGFSKTYSMTGWRVGYLTAPLWLAKRIIAFQSHTTSNVTTFAQYGALAALKGCAKAEVETMRQAFAARRDLIYKLVGAIPGVKCLRPQGAFYLLCDISAFGLSSDEFCTRLLEEAKLAVIPCAAFGAEGMIRLSYACSEDNIRKAAERLAAFTAKLSR